MGLIPGSGRSFGVGNGSPLQYSCLENSMDRGAHGITESQTWLSSWAHIHILGVTYVEKCKTLFLYWCVYHYTVSFIFLYGVCFEVYFVWYEYCDPSFPVICVCLKYLFLSLQSVGVLCPKASLLQAAYCWLLFFLIQPVILCVLIGAFSPLTFMVTTDRYVFITILNLVFPFILYFLSFFLFFLWFDDFLFYYVCA